MKLSKDIESAAKLQDYSKKPSIQGVKIINLKRFVDEGGAFTELARLSGGILEGEINLPILQISFSEMEPGAIKAFHFHRYQTDIWYVAPHDKVLLILHDLREDSSTYKVTQEVILGDCQSQLIVIPPGVAHGCKNIAEHRAAIFYMMDRQFDPDPAKCDEWRLPWDFLGKEIWNIQPE